MKNFQLQHRDPRNETPRKRDRTHGSIDSRRDPSKRPIFLFSSVLAIFDSKKKKRSLQTHRGYTRETLLFAKDPVKVGIRFPRNVDNRGKPRGNVNFFSSVKISVATKSPVHPSLTSCTSDFRTTDNRVKIRACTSACIRMLVLKIRNRRLSRIIKTRRCVCAGTRARNSTQIRWSVYVCTQNEGGRKRERCVCVGERGGDVAWWRGNVCERNAAKKTGHVC